MTGYDIDGVVTAGIVPEPGSVVISGRTFAEYDATCRALAQRLPVYIRGVGALGDETAAGHFKAMMIRHLGVTRFHEDSPPQIVIIRAECPDVEVIAP